MARVDSDGGQWRHSPLLFFAVAARLSGRRFVSSTSAGTRYRANAFNIGLSTLGAIALLGERPTPLALSGIVLIAVGVFLLTFKFSSSANSFINHRWLQSIIYALLTGLFIAPYTLWDKFAVSQLQIPPLIYDWSANLSRTLLLTPLVIAQWSTVKYHWQTHRREVLGVACLSPLAYILVLTALVFSPVSYVAPAREISIVIGTAMGTQLLTEADGKRRLLAAGLMALGVVALALG